MPTSLRSVLAGLLLAWMFFMAEPAMPAQSLPGISAPASTQRITSPVNDHRRTILHGDTSPMARREFDRGRAPDRLPEDHILMMLKRDGNQERALKQFMEEQYDPQSANFHKWLTPEQFGSLFGPSTEDIHQVTRWLSHHGFTVNRVSPGRTFIDFNGTAGQVTEAFHTEIHRYRIGGEDHFANAGDPSVPEALAPVVSGFRALNNFHPQPIRRKPGIARFNRATGRWSPVSPHLLTGGTGANAAYLVGPQDFAQIYGVNQVWGQSISTPEGPEKLVGSGQTIGIVGDTDLVMSDVDSFRNQFGITALGPHGSVVVDHPPASVCAAPDPGRNDPEGYLDAEWAGATAPDATIDFVTCADSEATLGTDLAATYIVQDPAHAQRIGVLSSSYGSCEANPVGESAQFYVSLWQQAAAEGMTVVVASGDTGAAMCDALSFLPYAVQGAGVNAAASTPYNIAAGGTDFSDIFSGTTGNYWSATNDATLGSAKSYIPETPWNETCASPLVLEAFGQGLSGSGGPGGFCAYAAQQPVDPATGFAPYFIPFAGGGGLSVVSPRPAWQTGVAGIPNGAARAVPDISMFASAGYTWGHGLIYCDSQYLPPGITCDFSDANNLYDNEDGGTSFVAPAFAGIMALIDQKSGARQGQANRILYPLAGQQYVMSNSRTQPNLATCAAYLGPNVLSSCYFHDISGTPNPNPATRGQMPFLIGDTAIPCTGSATAPGVFTDASTDPASHSENCYGYQITVTQNGDSLTTTPNYYGVLSTEDNASSPAFQATPGYDLATGLGSPNVAALVNAPQWSSGGVVTVVNLAPASSTITSAQTLTLEATVTSNSGGSPVRGGGVTFYSGNTVLGAASLGCGGKGVATLLVTGASFGGVGVFSDVHAVYSGGVAHCGRRDVAYFGSQSASVTVTVALASVTITGSPVYPATQCCFFNQPIPLKVVAAGVAGDAPTGSVQIRFNGQTIGTGALTPASSSTSEATIPIDASSLAIGNNTVSLVYGGDADYLPADGSSTVAIRDPSIPFGIVPVNRTSEIDVKYTYTVAGAMVLDFNPGGAPSTDFSSGRLGSCRSGVAEAVGYECTIGIAFRPSQPGFRKGAVEVTLQGGGGPSASTPLYLFPNGVGGAAQIALSAETQLTLNASLDQPQSAAFDPTGKTLFVANSGAAQIVTVPPDGGTFTPWSTGKPALVYPTDLTFDGLGNLLVGDGGAGLSPNATHGDVIRFTPAGSAQTVSTGTLSPILPTALRTDGGGNLYIADAGSAQVIEVPSEGAAPHVVDLGGLNLSFPQGMALDNSGENLYVADGDTNQIVKIPLDGSESASQVSIGPCAPSIADCSLYNPTGIAFNLNGDMYVVDSAHYRVLTIPSTHASQGTPTTVLPMTGLLNASNITLDGEGNLYVPDIVNGRLYKLLIASGSVSFSGQAGQSIPVTVTNIGNRNLRIAKLAFARGNNSNFSETDNCARVTIAPGGGCTIDIRSKHSAGSAQDVLSVLSNATSTATITVSQGSPSASVRGARR